MFLSSSIRPFTQNENPDNAGFKKPGALKSTGSNLRTPFKDRSVNSVSPSSKYNSKLQMKQQEPVIKKTLKNDLDISTKLDVKKEEIIDSVLEDFDFASYKDVDYGYADIYPSKRLDVMKLLSDYVSRGSPKYVPETDFLMDSLVELPVPDLELRLSPLPSFNEHDVELPLPIFNDWNVNE